MAVASKSASPHSNSQLATRHYSHDLCSLPPRQDVVLWAGIGPVGVGMTFLAMEATGTLMPPTSSLGPLG